MGDDRRTWFGTLLSRAKKQDHAARNRLFEENRSWLVKWTRRRMPGWLVRRESASDVVQEGLLAADQGLSRFQGRDEPAFRSWLRSIINKVFLQRIRYNRQQQRDLAKEVPLQAGSSNGSWIAAGPCNRALHSSEPEDIEFVHPALALLTEDERRRFLLQYDEELSFDEIEQREGVPSGTLRKQVRRTAEKLRVRIELLKRMEQLQFVPLQKQAICLWSFQTATEPDIAAQLKIPKDAVTFWIRDARARGLIK